MYTGKLGTFDAQPGNFLLGGQSPTEGGEIEVDAVSTLALTSTASCTILEAEAESTLALTVVASTPVPWHAAATSTLSFTITVGSSIKMVSASSPISLTSTASKNIHDEDASSALALTSTARATTLEVAGTSALSVTDSARPGLFKPVATSPISLVQTVEESGVRRTVAASSALALTVTASTPRVLHKSASSAIVLVSAGIGIGPHIGIAASALSLTDAARSGVWTAQAVNVLVLADVGRITEIFLASASSPLVLAQQASQVNLHVYATSTLALTDTADTQTKVRSAITTIDALASAAIAQVIHPAVSVLALSSTAVSTIVGLRAESELELEDEARNVSIKVAAEEHELELTQEVTSNIKMLSMTDTLALAQTLFVNRPWYGVAESELTTVELVFDLDTFTLIEVITGLQDSASVIVDSPRNARSIISFYTQAIGSHVRADGIDCDAESVLSLTQEGRISIPKSASSTLALSQTASGNVSIPVVSQLSTLNVAAQVVVVRALSASNSLGLNQAVAFIFEQSDTLCTYTPFVGSSSDPNAPTPPSATYPAAGGTPGFRLQYPASGAVTDQLILRAPNLGNQDRLAMTRINRETRGGTLIIYADPIWPKVQTLLLSFSGLSQQEGQNLLTFMENYLGQEIRLIDWEDRLWRGVIVNPQDPVVPDGPGCKYTASFEFEGEKV